MVTARIHFDQRQKRRLTKRACLPGTSFEQEVCNAVDFYLSLPVATEAELTLLAKLANDSADRAIARLDEAIAHIDKILRSTGSARRRALPRFLEN
jgi:flagellin-like hook-associated protein FlgL